MGAIKSTASRIAAAKRLFKKFRLQSADGLARVESAPLPKVAMLVGTLDTVEYTTVRDGRVEHYRHEFADNSRPLLVSNDEGTAIFIIGGRYNFTERGIVDY